MPNQPALAWALCRFLSEEGIDHCVLAAGCEPAPGEVHALDLVVRKTTLARLAPLLKTFGARHEAQLVQYRQLARDRIHRYLLSWPGREQRPEFLWVNARADYLRCGRALFTAEELLRDRVLQPADAPRGIECWRVAPAKEFICHLLRCIDAGALTQRDGAHLSEQWQQDSEGGARQTDRFWISAREGGVIMRAAASGHWDPVHASLPALHAALLLRNVASPAAWLREQWTGASTWFAPGGLMIACLGPEGSGKRSVIQALHERPLAPFRRVHTMELRPRLMRPVEAKTAEPARLRKPRGRLGTTAKLMMFVADYWLGYWLRIRPKLACSTLVVSNRYYDDVLVDPRRYRMDRPRTLARVLLPWIPRPELWLIFDVSSEILRQRHADVAAEEAARLRGEYRCVLRGRENVVVLDAGQPLEKVIAQAQRAIVTQLARRTAGQLGLPLETMNNPAVTTVLLFFCRRRVPVLSALVRMLFNSDIRGRLPDDVHMPHPYGIVVHPRAVIGHRVTLMQQVTIGGRDCSENIAPLIGDDVHIGAGARVLGDVRVGNGAVIGANAVVTRDIPPGATVVGANRIVATNRNANVGVPSDPAIARFPVGVQRNSRGQTRQPF